MADERARRETTIPIWIWALVVVAVLALIFLWWAFTRNNAGLLGEDGELDIGMLEENGQTAQQQDIARIETALADAEQRLSALADRLQNEPVSEEMLEEVRNIRSELAQAHENATGEARERWENLDEDLQELEQNLQMRTG